MNVDSQTEIILGMLRAHPEGITSLDALRACGTMRLAARISDLKARGHDITTEMVKLDNGKRVARYRLLRGSLWGAA